MPFANVPKLLPTVDHIHGCRLTKGPTPASSIVQLQYRGVDNVDYELAIPFLDAMYLLNLLKAFQQQTGFQMPDDPFAPQP